MKCIGTLSTNAIAPPSTNGQIPAWIVRWGITLLFLVVVALLVGSCFFKYPDVITADMTLISLEQSIKKEIPIRVEK